LKILLVSDAIWLNSGYANVSRNIIPFIQDMGHEVILLPFVGPEEGGFAEEVLGVKVLPTLKSVSDIKYWYYRLDCDLAIILKDPYAVPGIQDFAIFWVGHMPIAEEPAPGEWLDITSTALRLWIPSRWGIKVLEESGADREVLRYLPHGVLSDIYRPILDVPKEKLREKLGFKDKDFIIGIVAVNRERKLIPNQLEVVKIFMENNRDLRVGIYLHTRVHPDNPIHGGWYLDSVIKTMRFPPGTIRFPEQMYYRLGFDDLEMCLAYNGMDALLELTTEGFGLPILEAESCGVPVVTVEHGNGPEINFLGLNARVAGKLYTMRGSWWAIPDPYHAADLLERVLAFDSRRVARFLHGKAKSFDWESVAAKYFKPLLEEVEGELVPERIHSKLVKEVFA